MKAAETTEARALEVLRKVASRLGLAVERYPAETPNGKLIGAVGDWAAGTRWRDTAGAKAPDEFGDVEPDYRAHPTGEWVWVSPGDSGEPGSWGLGRTATGVGIDITRGDGERPADVEAPEQLAAAIMSALRRDGPTPGDAP